MKKTTKTDSTAREAQHNVTGKEQAKTQAAATMPDFKALQDKARQLLRPQQYGGYAGF